jgi:hypothetical protein
VEPPLLFGARQGWLVCDDHESGAGIKTAPKLTGGSLSPIGSCVTTADTGMHGIHVQQKRGSCCNIRAAVVNMGRMRGLAVARSGRVIAAI